MDERMMSYHFLLLRLAGMIPDDTLVRCRDWLAEGDVRSLARAVSHAALAARVQLVQRDQRVLAALFDEGGVNPARLSLLDRVEFEAVSRFDFVTTVDDAYAELEKITSGQVGYTGLRPTVVDGPVDPVERALADATSGETGVVASWRAWRYPLDGAPWPPPQRVFVVETKPDTDVVAVAAGMQRVLVAAGETDPLVEVYPAGAALPAYQYFARGSGALLWAREPDPGVRVAKLYDEVDPKTGPRIDPNHPTMDDPERSWVLRYLESGEPLLVTSATMEDVINPQSINPVPMSYRTDGFWIWNDAVAYYLKRHGVAPDQGLVGHIRDRGYAFMAVGGVGLHRAHAALIRLMTG